MHIGHGELMPQIARFVVTLLSAGVGTGTGGRGKWPSFEIESRYTFPV